MAGEQIQTELETYRRLRDELVEHYLGKYVLIHGTELVDTYDTFNKAASEAVNRFGKQPFLIRRVEEDAEAVPLPASVAFHPVHADH